MKRPTTDEMEEGFWDQLSDTSCQEVKLTQSPVVWLSQCCILTPSHSEKLAFHLLSWEQVRQYFSAGKGN